MEIDGNNDITTLGNDIEGNEETSTAFGSANEKEAENEIDEGSVVQVYCCTMCDQKFSVEKYLEAHVYVRHGVGKMFNCPYCDMTFDDKRSLKLHEKTHKSLQTFSCSACNKKFKSKQNLKSHERRHNGITWTHWVLAQSVF